MEGILLINKPIGPSSFDVVRKVRKLAGIKRVGHAGTLDPLASGLMVLCLGRYTKLAGHLTESSKVYESVFRLGVSSNTDDNEGNIIEEKPLDGLQEKNILDALGDFRGTIEQIPPRFSAIKIDGVRAYKMARGDENFEISPRIVTIFELSVTKISMPEVHVRVHCSKGTYIRALARDLGLKLGVGALASGIKRVKSGNFSVTEALDFEHLSAENLKAALRTGKDAVGGLAVIDLSKEDMLHAKHGRSLTMNSPIVDYAIGFFDGEPVALLKQEENVLKVARGF